MSVRINTGSLRKFRRKMNVFVSSSTSGNTLQAVFHLHLRLQLLLLLQFKYWLKMSNPSGAVTFIYQWRRDFNVDKSLSAGQATCSVVCTCLWLHIKYIVRRRRREMDTSLAWQKQMYVVINCRNKWVVLTLLWCLFMQNRMLQKLL